MSRRSTTPGTVQYGNNNVPVTLKNGPTMMTAFSPGPVRRSVLGDHDAGTVQRRRRYLQDVSITERWKLRVNVDSSMR